LTAAALAPGLDRWILPINGGLVHHFHPIKNSKKPSPKKIETKFLWGITTFSCYFFFLKSNLLCGCDLEKGQNKLMAHVSPSQRPNVLGGLSQLVSG